MTCYAQVFEVTSAKPNVSADPGTSSGLLPDGRSTATNVTLKVLLRRAYRVQNYQISGGPGWMESDRFGVIGLAEKETPALEILTMLQALLEDRFQLVVRREMRERPGVRIETGAEWPAPWQEPEEKRCERWLREFAAALGNQLGVPIVDQTGLKGNFDIRLEWALEGPADTSNPSVFSAIGEQPGLRLEARRGTVGTIVVDHVERPSAN